MQRSHAIANGCYVCVPNRIGHEIIKDTKGKPVDKDGIVFWGQSFVASPDGQVVERAPVDKETVMVVDCDLAKVEFSRTHWPFLRDRRIDAYGDADQALHRLMPGSQTGAQARTRQGDLRHKPRVRISAGVASASGHLDQLAAAGRDFVSRAVSRAIEDIAGVIRVARRARAKCIINVPNDNYERLVREFLQGAARAAARASSSITSRPTKPGPAITGRRSCCASGAARRGGDRRLGLQRVGRQVSAVGCRRCGADADRRGAEAAGVLSAASSWKAARSTSTAPAPC